MHMKDQIHTNLCFIIAIILSGIGSHDRRDHQHESTVLRGQCLMRFWIF